MLIARRSLLVLGAQGLATVAYAKTALAEVGLPLGQSHGDHGLDRGKQLPLLVQSVTASESAKDEEFPSFEKLPMGLHIGDNGYRHHEYHAFYKQVFGAKLGCKCSEDTGDCRVSVWRYRKTGRLIETQALVNRMWVTLDGNVKFPDPRDVPVELTRDYAHICAYPTFRDGNPYFKVECAILNDKQG